MWRAYVGAYEPIKYISMAIESSEAVLCYNCLSASLEVLFT